MPLTEEQLRERWKTPKGHQRRNQVTRALADQEDDWEKTLIGFAGVDEVENGRDLRGIDPHPRKFPKSHFEQADLSFAEMIKAELPEADLSFARLERTNLIYATLTKAGMFRAFLKNSNLTYAVLDGANLEEADLRMAVFYGAILTNVYFAKARLNHKTDLRAIRFSPEHPVSYDGSETIKIPLLDRWGNWAKIRKIGQFPLFGVSWTAFALSLTVVNFLGAINTGLVKFGVVTVPIPMPLRMELILLDSILLVLGTTLYKLCCPDAIQEFSEVQWVSQHHQPRLIYYREMWRKWWLVWPTGIFSISGAAIALYLIGERVVMAAKYLLDFGW